jgi:hypothetical protein
MLDYAKEALAMVHGRSRADLDTDRQLNLSLVRADGAGGGLASIEVGGGKWLGLKS